MKSVGPVEIADQTFQTIRLPTARFHCGPEVAVSVFPGHQTLISDVSRAADPSYRAIATGFGYRDERRYARHHDLTHHWIAAARGETCSPALLSAAEGNPWPPEHRAEHEREERWVNSAQRSWARARNGEGPLSEDVRAMREALGPMWRELAAELWSLLDAVR